MAKAKTSTELRSWDQDLAAAAVAASAKASKSAGGGRIFGTKGGILSIDGSVIPGNSVDVIVLEYIAVNAKYPKYDPANPSGPSCFAFEPEDSDAAMAPDAGAAHPESEDCLTCPMNAFGSDEQTGKGKACKNLRRLAVIACGNTLNGRTTFFKPDELAKQPLAFMHVSPTSGKLWDGFVKQIGNVQHRPPFGVRIRISLRQHITNQFEFVFDFIDNVPNEFREVVMQRVAEAQADIRFPFAPFAERPAAPARGAAKPAAAAKRSKY